MSPRPLPALLAPLVVALVALAPTAPARALDEPVLCLDAELGYGGYADERRYHGMFAGLESAFALSDFWGLRAGYGFAVHRGKGKAFETQLIGLGVRYQLDIFHYVPWIDLSPTAYVVSGDGGPGSGGHFGIGAGLGFDRLLDPRWSLGVGARYHMLFGQSRFPAYLTVAVRLGYRWTFGDPFAP